MHPNCINSVNRAAGRTLKKSELDNIEGRLNGTMKRLSRSDKDWAAKPKEQQVAEASALAMKDMQFEAQKKLQRQQGQVIALARESAALTARAGEIDGKTPGHKAAFERVMQVENMVNGERHNMMSQLVDAIKAVEPRFLGLMENPTMVRDFIIEVYRGKTGRGSGNVLAEKGAKAYMEMMEKTRQRRNALGQDVGQMEAYTPRGYDVGRVARAGAQEFATDAMRGADRSAYVHEDGTRMTDDQLRQFLQAAWETLATEGRNKLVPGQSARGSRASKFDDAHRQIHFADGESELAFMAKYGRGTLLHAIQGHVSQAAKDIGMMEEFGPSPSATWRMLKDTAEIIDNKEGARQFGATLDQAWDVLNGTTAQPVSANLAKAGQGVRNWTSAAKLGSVLISSINDMAGTLVTAYHNGIPLAMALKNNIKAYGGKVKEDATRLGLATEYIAGEMRQWHADNLAQGWTDNLANTANKLSLIEAWTHAGRRGFGLSLSSVLNDMRALDWAALKKQDRERMTVAGIDEATWKVWQQAKATDFDGTPILTKDGIQGIEGLDQGTRDRATAKLLGYIDQEAGMAIMKPDLITRAAITQGTRAGTWGGEIARSLMLFKSFPLAMMFQHFRRIQSIDSNAGKAAYSVAMLTGTTLLGALSLQLKDLIVGKEPRDMMTGKFWGAAAAQGGGIGIFGDVLYTGLGGNNSGGQPNWANLAGPVIGTVLDAANLTIGNVGQVLQGKKTNAGAEALRFAKQNMPGANLFYAKAVIDHWFLHDLQETLSPGYLGRMRASLQKDWHQGYWWAPGAKFSEAKVPDLSQALGR